MLKESQSIVSSHEGNQFMQHHPLSTKENQPHVTKLYIWKEDTYFTKNKIGKINGITTIF